jgi:2-oxoisovalerate dehydrogenase E1 component
MSAVAVAEGSDSVTTEELVAAFPGRTADDVARLTGIEVRRRAAAHESALTLAVAAARRALDHEGLTIHDIDAVVCSTATPPQVTPSMACLILHDLCRGGRAREIPAHDVNAACSGYLYALTSGFDLIRHRPDARVLVVTAEAMSRVIDPTDFDTAILFGDAATATVLSGPGAGGRPWALLRRPVLSAKGEDGSSLSVGGVGRGHVRMDGRRVFPEAVRQMAALLRRACDDAGLDARDLGLVVPHQANARILAGVGERLGVPPARVFSNIGRRGNTASSSIPLCLSDLAGRGPLPGKVGLVAFGGGFTSAGAIIEAPTPGGWPSTAIAAAGCPGIDHL